MTVFEFDGGKKLPMRYNLRAFFAGKPINVVN